MPGMVDGIVPTPTERWLPTEDGAQALTPAWATTLALSLIDTVNLTGPSALPLLSRALMVPVENVRMIDTGRSVTPTSFMVVGKIHDRTGIWSAWTAGWAGREHAGSIQLSDEDGDNHEAVAAVLLECWKEDAREGAPDAAAPASSDEYYPTKPLRRPWGWPDRGYSAFWIWVFFGFLFGMSVGSVLTRLLWPR